MNLLYQFFLGTPTALLARRTTETLRAGSRPIGGGGLAARINRGAADFPLVFAMVQAADHRTPATGLSPTVLLSKGGGPFAPPAGAVSELGSGWYAVAASAADTGTLGPLLLHATATGADPADLRFDVIPGPGATPIALNTPGAFLPFLLVSAADHVTGLAGASPSVLLSKGAGAFAPPAGTVSELGYGLYGVAAAIADVNTPGPLLLRAAAPGADDALVRFEVTPPVRGATTFPLVFSLVLAADHRSAATGKSPSVLLSKAGSAFAPPAGAVTELGYGAYAVAASAADLSTVGPLIVHATAPGADPADAVYNVALGPGVPPVVQGAAATPLPFLVVSASDHVTGLAGAKPTVLLSKDGSSFAAPAGSVTEVGNGWYTLSGAAADVGTAGPLALHATTAGADPADAWLAVVPAQLAAAGRLGNGPTPNLLRNRVNLVRLTTPNPDSDGALGNAWVPLATGVPSSVQPGEPRREERQGSIRSVVPTTVLFGTNPALVLGDQVQWTDDLGTLHTITVAGIRNLAGRGAAYLVEGEEVI